MATFEAELPKSQGTPSLVSLAADYTSFKAFVLETMNNFQQQIEILAHTVDTMEMRGRRKMLLLHGVPEEKKEDVSETAVRVVKHHLKLSNITTEDIRRCHRMGRSSVVHKPRPIVIKFNTITVRDNVWFSKTKFKGTGITVSEFLTKQRHETFMAARQKFSVSQSWTKEGVIHVIGSNGVRHRITKLNELNKIDQQEEEIAVIAAKPATKTKRTVSQKK